MLQDSNKVVGPRVPFDGLYVARKVNWTPRSSRMLKVASRWWRTRRADQRIRRTNHGGIRDDRNLIAVLKINLHDRTP